MAKNIDEMKKIAYRLPVDYCRMVREARYPRAADMLSTKLMHYVQNHIGEKVVAQELAQSFAVTPSYLSRVFRAATGVSIPQYVREQKIIAAKYMLLFDDSPLAEIADRLAFSSQSHFQRCFKEIVGTTPADFRKKGERESKAEPIEPESD